MGIPIKDAQYLLCESNSIFGNTLQKQRFEK